MNAPIIKKNTIASVYYRGTLTKNGEEFDNNRTGDPLTFLVGFQQMIPGFESALMGKTEGEKLTFTLSPSDAYGEYDPESVKVVPLAQLPNGVKVGDTLALQAPDGQIIPLRVSEKNEESATLDMNHALAGEALTFEVEILKIRDANKEELSNGMTMEQISAVENDCCSSGSCSS